MRLVPPFTSEKTLLGHGIYLAALALVLFLIPGLVRFLLSVPSGTGLVDSRVGHPTV